MRLNLPHASGVKEHQINERHRFPEAEVTMIKSRSKILCVEFVLFVVM